MQSNIETGPVRFALSFGKRASFIHNNIHEFTDAVATVINTLQEYDSLNSSSEFYYASSFIDLNGLKLAASVSSPSSYKVNDGEGYYFFLPIGGQATATADGKTGISAAGHQAFLSPEIARSGVTSELSMVQASVCQSRIYYVASSMVGERVLRKIKPMLESPSYISVETKGVNYQTQFERIFDTIDDLNLSQNKLIRLGVDDLFYRTLVSMIVDNCGADAEIDVVVSGSIRAADKVAEYIAANYWDEITLTKLEQISGVTGKTLSASFKKRFSCSPMQWLQDYRLKTFRHLLQTARQGETVTSLAYSCGFTRMGALSGRYAEVYGEKPSQTLAGSCRH